MDETLLLNWRTAPRWYNVSVQVCVFVYLLRIMWSHFIYLFSCLVQSRLRLRAGMHYFMIRLSMSRSVEPIKDDVVFGGLSFSLAYVGVCLCIFYAHHSQCDQIGNADGLRMTMMRDFQNKTREKLECGAQQQRKCDK